MLRKTVGALAAAFVLLVSLPSGAGLATPDSFDKTQHSLTQANSLWVLVNKKHPLNPIKYAPAKLVRISTFNPDNLPVASVTATAFLKMAKAGKAAGAGSISIASGYRSYNRQVQVHAQDVARYGLVAGEKLAARPGYSEHQTGLAVDVFAPGQGCRIRVCFGTTKAGTWLRENAWQYGFIVRYPDGSYPITGYQYEPWHLRYVGVELSTELHDRGVTILENFFNYDPAPTY
jgi:D-alanyl-D-alanine carboxypeptidase